MTQQKNTVPLLSSNLRFLWLVLWTIGLQRPPPPQLDGWNKHIITVCEEEDIIMVCEVEDRKGWHSTVGPLDSAQEGTECLMNSSTTCLVQWGHVFIWNWPRYNHSGRLSSHWLGIRALVIQNAQGFHRFLSGLSVSLAQWNPGMVARKLVLKTLRFYWPYRLQPSS